MAPDPTPPDQTEGSDDAALGPDGFDQRTAAAVQRVALLIRSL